MIGGFEEPTGADLPRRPRRRRPAAVQARRQHRLPELRALPAHDDLRQRRVRARAAGDREEGDRSARARGARARRPRGAGEPQAEAALRRPAAARRAGARARQQPARAAPRRAARRARPEAAQADAARAEADPERGRDHVRPRHARPGGGDDDGGHDRRDEQRPDRAARHARPSCTSGRGRRSSPASSASRTCCTDTSKAPAPSGSRTAREVSARDERRAGRDLRRGPAGEDLARRRGREQARRARSARAAYIGVATEIVVATPVGELTVFHQNVEAGGVVPPLGSEVTISGRPRRRSSSNRTERGHRMTMRITRRELVQRGAAGATILSLPGLLAACGGGGGGGGGGRRHTDVAPLLELAALHRHRREDEEVAHARAVHGEDRHQGRVLRGHQLERRVLREDPGAALEGRRRSTATSSS